MMHSPQLMNHARRWRLPAVQRRDRSVLSEFAILIAAREWTQDYEW